METLKYTQGFHRRQAKCRKRAKNSMSKTLINNWEISKGNERRNALRDIMEREIVLNQKPFNSQKRFATIEILV